MYRVFNETPRSKLTRYLNRMLSFYTHQDAGNKTLETPSTTARDQFG